MSWENLQADILEEMAAFAGVAPAEVIRQRLGRVVDPDANRERSARWRAENPGYSTAYYRRNKERLRLQQRVRSRSSVARATRQAWLRRNRELVRAHVRASYRKHRQQRLERQRAYYQRNREAIAARRRAARAAKRASGEQAHPPSK